MASRNNWNPELSNRASNIATIASTGISTMSSINMRNVTAQVAAAVDGQTKLITSAFAESLNGQVYRNRRSRMTAIHREVGFKAQNAALTAYLEKHSPKSHSGYRSRAAKPWQRDSGGKMISALSDPNVMFRASWDGLEYVNMTLFSKKAKQWYRLNFGAKGRSGSKYKSNGGSQSFVMNFFGASNTSGTVGPFSFEGYDPSRAFTIPKGLFVNEQGKPVPVGSASGQEFVPLAARGIDLPGNFKNSDGSGKKLIIGRRTLASGIAGSHFLDDGLRAITVHLPVAYTGLMNEWFAQAAAGVKSSPVSMVGVSANDARKYVSQLEKQILAYRSQGLLS